MYQIHQIESNYFVSRPNHPHYLAQLVVPGTNNELTKVCGFTRVYESACHLIYLEASGNVTHYKPENVFTNWSEFPQLAGVEVFAICDLNEHGNQYRTEAESLGISLIITPRAASLEAINRGAGA